MKDKQKLNDLLVKTELKILLPIIKSLRKSKLKKIIDTNSYYDVPIYIVSYNRLSYLKKTINWLKTFGYKNIMIIDNSSTLPDLLEFYKKCDCKVIKMKKNYGYKVFYKSFKFFFKRNFSVYALTDPDLEPIKECPNNFMEIFVKAMYKFPSYSKVGFSLKFDDLPDRLTIKDQVIRKQESLHKIIKEENGDIKYYDSQLDTTFALCAPLLTKRSFYYAIRVGEPYQLRHLPWYEEKHDEYYQKTKISSISEWYTKE